MKDSERGAGDDGEKQQWVTSTYTLGDLRKAIQDLPDSTVIFLETEDLIEPMGGGVFVPKEGVLSFIGANTEIALTPDEVGEAQIFGDVARYDEHEDGDGSGEEGPPFDVDNDDGTVAETTIQLPGNPLLGEVDAPARPEA